MRKPTYLIAEIGQNHNGSVDVAKLIIDLIVRPVVEKLFEIELDGIDAIKLQKRDLNQELSSELRNSPYDSPHSFGATYGEHREYLELSEDEHLEIYNHAKANGLDVIETLCAPSCLSILQKFRPDYLKVASRDVTNHPLLASLAETGIPIIISTGMSNEREVDDAIEIVAKYHSNIRVLHCVSEYPTHPDNVNLLTIPYLQRRYPAFQIGYSDHTIGISAPVAAVALGAEIIEKHVTIDRRLKGSDQAGALGPDGIIRMTRDIRLLERSLGVDGILVPQGVNTARSKLERSIAAKSAIAKGTRITEEMLYLLSPGTGLRWTERARIIGATARRDVAKDELISLDSLDNNHVS